MYYAMKLNVNLNDFANFDQVLFNAEDMKLPEKERWKKFYRDDQEAIYIPLPDMPTTIAEYQFCHYIYWMTIWANGVTYKPWIYFSFMGKVTKPRVSSACFACAYVGEKRLGYTNYCPIKLYRCVRDKKCVDNTKGPYAEWMKLTLMEDFPVRSVSEQNKLKASAYDIAHLEWEEERPDNCKKIEKSYTSDSELNQMMGQE